MKKAIMVAGCHADDVEIQAGGTLAKYMAMGYAGYYVMFTRSNSGYNCLKPESGYDYSEKISAMRLKEVAQAAGVFGAKLICMDFKEHLYTLENGMIVYADIRNFPELGGRTASGREPIVVACRMQKYIDEFAALIEEAEPEVIIVHDTDINPDHYASFLITLNAVKAAAKTKKIGNVYMRMTTNSLTWALGMEPDFFVDVTGFEETVFKAINKHVTQVKCMSRDAALKREWERLAGQVAGARYVEAFRRIKTN